MPIPPLDRRLHAKISTMPRRQSEAACYLDIYRLMVEKKRLQQELAGLEKRGDRIKGRLKALEQQISHLNHRAAELQSPNLGSEPSSVVYPPSGLANPDDSARVYKTVTLDY